MNDDILMIFICNYSLYEISHLKNNLVIYLSIEKSFCLSSIVILNLELKIEEYHSSYILFLKFYIFYDSLFIIYHNTIVK